MALVLCAPRPGQACYDERITTVGPVVISEYDGDGGGMTPLEQGDESMVTWAARLARILPAGARLEILSGPYVAQSEGVEIKLCLRGQGCSKRTVESAHIAKIFDRIATRVRIPAAERARARRFRPALFTLQAGAFSDERAAQELAWRIDGDLEGVGADILQGHPGPAHSVHVDEHTLPDGRRVHRTLAGVFTSRADAARAGARIAAKTGVRPLVRSLPRNAG